MARRFIRRKLSGVKIFGFSLISVIILILFALILTSISDLFSIPLRNWLSGVGIEDLFWQSFIIVVGAILILTLLGTSIFVIMKKIMRGV